jgi:hypothetical protein
MNTSELEAKRAEIDAEIRQQQQAEAMSAWRQAQADARSARDQAEEAVRSFHRAEAAALAFERECEKVRLEIEEHNLAQPQPDSFPTVEEQARWSAESARLSTLLTVTMRARRLGLADIRERARLEAVKTNELLQSLAYAERVLRTRTLEI